MSNRDPHDVVRLRTAPTPAMAHLWEQALREEGISAKVVGDYLNAAFGDISGLQAELWVHRDDVPAAEKILSRSPDSAAGPAAGVPTPRGGASAAAWSFT